MFDSYILSECVYYEHHTVFFFSSALILRAKPIPTERVIRLDPPELKNGNVTPVNGIIPVMPLY